MERTIREATGDGAGPEIWLAPGVRALDHTADVGFDVYAPSLEALFERAARGLIALLRGDDRAGTDSPPAPGRTVEGRTTGGAESRQVAVEAPDAGALLVAWLRELLWLYESSGFAVDEARFDTLTATALAADVRGAPETFMPAREIKGVTYHGLDVARTDDGWHARMIFDV